MKAKETKKWKENNSIKEYKRAQMCTFHPFSTNIHINISFSVSRLEFLFNFHNCHRLILSTPAITVATKSQQTNQFTFRSVRMMRARQKLHSFSYRVSHQKNKKQYTKLKKSQHNPIRMWMSWCDEIENIIMFFLYLFWGVSVCEIECELHGHGNKIIKKNRLVNRSKPFNFFAIFAECVSFEIHHIAFFDFLFWRTAQNFHLTHFILFIVYFLPNKPTNGFPLRWSHSFAL